MRHKLIDFIASQHPDRIRQNAPVTPPKKPASKVAAAAQGASKKPAEPAHANASNQEQKASKNAKKRPQPKPKPAPREAPASKNLDDSLMGQSRINTRRKGPQSHADDPQNDTLMQNDISQALFEHSQPVEKLAPRPGNQSPTQGGEQNGKILSTDGCFDRFRLASLLLLLLFLVQFIGLSKWVGLMERFVPILF